MSVARNKETVKQYFKAIEGRDMEGLKSLLAEEACLIFPPSTAGFGDYGQGRDAYIQAINTFLSDFYAPGYPKIEIVKVIGEGDEVVCQIKIRGKFPNGNPYENPYVTIHTFNGEGKIIQCWELMDTLNAANQFGGQ